MACISYLRQVFMDYREFTKTGAKVSAIGMGTYYGPIFIGPALICHYYNSRSRKIASLRKGIESGIDLIDTAEIYQTESIVAEVIQD